MDKEEFSEGLISLKAPLSDDEREVGSFKFQLFPRSELSFFKTPSLQLVVKFLNNKPPRNKVDYLSFARGVKIPFPTEEDGPLQVVLTCFKYK